MIVYVATTYHCDEWGWEYEVFEMVGASPPAIAEELWSRVVNSSNRLGYAVLYWSETHVIAEGPGLRFEMNIQAVEVKGMCP